MAASTITGERPLWVRSRDLHRNTRERRGSAETSRSPVMGRTGSNQPEAVIHDLVQPKPVFVLSVKSRTPPGSSRYQPPLMNGWLNGLGRSHLTAGSEAETVCFSATECLQLNRHQPAEQHR